MRLKPFYILILCILLFNACKEQDIPEEINWEYERFAKHKTFYECCKNFPKIKFKETKELKEGDELLLFGGDNRFFQKITGKDEVKVKIEKIFFIKRNGLQAIISFNDKLLQADSICFTVHLYYYNSKKGYEPLSLKIWEEKISDAMLSEVYEPENGLQLANELLDLNIGFKNLSTK